MDRRLEFTRRDARLAQPLSNYHPNLDRNCIQVGVGSRQHRPQDSQQRLNGGATSTVYTNQFQKAELILSTEQVQMITRAVSSLLYALGAAADA